MKQTIVQLSAIILCFVSFGLAQDPTPSQTPPTEEPIRVSTEEVHLNVLARSSSQRFVSDLKIDDLLVVEDGIPQEITNLQRVPANVLLLLDTGRDLNFAKSLNATQVIAEIFVHSLSPNNSLSVMQYYDKVETLSDWSTDYQLAINALNNKLFTGRRSVFTEALNAAIISFKSRPLENRHLVLVTDGVETVANNIAHQKALQNLLAANITIHILSYTQLEEQMAQNRTQRFKAGDGKTKPRVDPWIYENIIRGLPMDEKARVVLRQMNEAQALVIVNLDKEMVKRVSEKRVIWRENETKLQTLATDTGGIYQAPEELGTMFKLAMEIAKAVDSQYVITYTPKKPFTNSADGENRRVMVSSHCEGVKIQSRQKIVINPH